MGYLLRVLSVSAVLAIILYAGLRSAPIPQVFQHQDWLHHAAGFAALACVSRLAFPHTHLLWILLYCVLLACSIELAQGLMPRRTASLDDMLANLLGVAMGVLSAQLIRRYCARFLPLRS